MPRTLAIGSPTMIGLAFVLVACTAPGQEEMIFRVVVETGPSGR